VQQVGRDRGLADEQGGGDVGVAGAAGDQLQHLDLTGGEGLGPRGGLAHHLGAVLAGQQAPIGNRRAVEIAGQPFG
jgi:hypothetical protein